MADVGGVPVPTLINWGLMSNPVNWAIVILMWLIGALLMHIINQKMSQG